jgi:hypothetical protein
MLSTLPKLVDKTFVFGFFLPSLFFAIAMLFLFADTAGVQIILAKLSVLNAFENITYVILATWVIAFILLLCNYQWYRTLEGYSWPVAGSTLLLEREQRRFTDMLGKIAELQYISDHYPDDLSPKSADTLAALRRKILQQFGGNHESHLGKILPTRFGNAIRAFERYPNTAYGADGVTLWLHLHLVMSGDSRSLVADARSQVDLLINTCLLSLIVAVTAVLRFFVKLYGVATFEHSQSLAAALNHYASAFGFMVTSAYGYVLIALFALALSRLSYLAATDKASSWGNTVKTAYDLYLPALAEQMGYSLPSTSKEQREFWNEVCQRFLYRDPTDFTKWIATEKPEPKAKEEKTEAPEAQEDE